MLNILLLKVVELERRLESISAEFAGQISALKSQLEKERDRRIDLEAEVMFYINLIPGPYLVGGGYFMSDSQWYSQILSQIKNECDILKKCSILTIIPYKKNPQLIFLTKTMIEILRNGKFCIFVIQNRGL